MPPLILLPAASLPVPLPKPPTCPQKIKELEVTPQILLSQDSSTIKLWSTPSRKERMQGTHCWSSQFDLAPLNTDLRTSFLNEWAALDIDTDIVINQGWKCWLVIKFDITWPVVHTLPTPACRNPHLLLFSPGWGCQEFLKEISKPRWFGLLPCCAIQLCSGPPWYSRSPFTPAHPFTMSPTCTIVNSQQWPSHSF
jgi:hypothetical protein